MGPQLHVTKLLLCITGLYKDKKWLPLGVRIEEEEYRLWSHAQGLWDSLRCCQGMITQKPADSSQMTRELFRILEVSVLRASWGSTASSDCLVQSGVPS